MALHIYTEKNCEKVLAGVLDFQTLLILEVVFAQFKAKTGMHLSEYDDAVLAPNHSALLAELIGAHFKEKDNIGKISALCDQLIMASNNGEYIFFEGE